MPYDLSDSVPVAVDVRDAAGALTDAVTVALTITLPDGTTETPTVPNPPVTTGLYRYTYLPTQAGRHAWRFTTTTPNTAYQDVFEVRETVSPSLLSLADAKAHLNLSASNTSNDDELREYLEAATEIIESYVGPVVRRTHTARVRGGRSSIPLPHTQVLEVTAITVVSDGSSPVTLADLTVDTAAGLFGYKSGASIPYGEMDVTYTVGRVFVKANWTLAAKIVVKHNWETQLGNLPSIQGDSQGYVVTGGGYLVPYRAISLLAPDQVPAGFA
jgi:hypothetical protein